MAFNKDSNIFTFVFAISMCVFVAGVLAGTFSFLQSDIKYNQSAKNMVDLLSAIEVDSSREMAEIDFDKYITDFVVLDSLSQSATQWHLKDFVCILEPK